MTAFTQPAEWAALVDHVGGELAGAYVGLGQVLDDIAARGGDEHLAAEWAELVQRVIVLGKAAEDLWQEGHARYVAWLTGEGDRG